MEEVQAGWLAALIGLATLVGSVPLGVALAPATATDGLAGWTPPQAMSMEEGVSGQQEAECTPHPPIRIRGDDEFTIDSVPDTGGPRTTSR